MENVVRGRKPGQKPLYTLGSCSKYFFERGGTIKNIAKAACKDESAIIAAIRRQGVLVETPKERMLREAREEKMELKERLAAVNAKIDKASGKVSDEKKDAPNA